MNTKINRPYRIVYMGTPDFAVRPMSALCESEDVVLVITQPDRRAGRGRKLSESPVKEEAVRRGIPTLQPQRIGDSEAIGALREISFDLIVVAAFGQILPEEILQIPPLGCINIHASLLPKYRGASPIATAIIRGEKVTGVTTMMMNRGLDMGEILLQKSLDISDEETAGELSERLSFLGESVILETIKELREGRLQRRPQSGSEATYAPLLTKRQGEINWDQDPVQIRNFVRGMDPWPGAYTLFQGEPLKVWRVTPQSEPHDPGKVLSVRDRLIVGVKGGSVVIDELQFPGKKRVSGPDFLRGRHNIKEGIILGR